MFGFGKKSAAYTPEDKLDVCYRTIAGLARDYKVERDGEYVILFWGSDVRTFFGIEDPDGNVFAITTFTDVKVDPALRSRALEMINSCLYPFFRPRIDQNDEFQLSCSLPANEGFVDNLTLVYPILNRVIVDFLENIADQNVAALY